MTQKIHYLVGAVLFAGMFSLFTGIGMVNAILVDLAREFSTTVGAMGQLAALTAVSWSVFALIVGPVSNVYPHKSMVVIGLMIIGISMFTYSMSLNIWMLVAASLLFGLGGAIAGPNILSCIGEFYPAEIHGKMSAVIASATPVANLVGVPLCVIITERMGWNWSFFSLAVFVTLSSLLCGVTLPKNKPVPAKMSINYINSFIETFKHSTFLPIILANTVLQVTFWVVSTYFAAFLIHAYVLRTGQLAPLLSGIAAGQLVGTLIGGPMADRWDRIKLSAYFSLLLGVFGFTFVLFAHNMILSVIFGGLFMGLYSAGRPAFFSLMIMMSSTVRGTVMGIQAMSNHIGRAIGAAIGGFMLSVSGYSSLGVLCLILGVITSVMYFRLSATFKYTG